MNKLLLGVNIDHIATVRQARGTTYPDPILAAVDAEHAGADGITLHLREDRRHIQDHDVERLRDVLSTRMNLEIAVTEEMISLAMRIQPEHVCFVPEKREELTTEGGLDVITHLQKITEANRRLAEVDCEVSLFIDPDQAQIDAAVASKAPVIELHTGAYADAKNPEEQAIELEKIKKAASYAHSKGLIVNAGHGLNLENTRLIAAIPELLELNIGHAIIARACFIGMQNAVVEMKSLMDDARK